ncbi:accessory factor UbiK family protein [Fodinicurvata halophila]|uniref:accessory factor UbiK family protein n=1 Tax=Fodinicurvata halophila TaxID=1419723 RepID=UPI00362A36D2
MQSQNRLFDDLARVFGGAAGVASDVRTEAEARVRDQLEKLLSGMDLVTREEHEAVQAMAAKARSEQEELAGRVAALEARLAELETSAASGGGARPPRAERPPASARPPLRARPARRARARAAARKTQAERYPCCIAERNLARYIWWDEASGSRYLESSRVA